MPERMYDHSYVRSTKILFWSLVWPPVTCLTPPECMYDYSYMRSAFFYSPVLPTKCMCDDSYMHSFFFFFWFLLRSSADPMNACTKISYMHSYIFLISLLYEPSVCTAVNTCTRYVRLYFFFLSWLNFFSHLASSMESFFTPN